MFLLLALFAAQRLLPAVFTSKAWLAFVVALYPLLTAASLLTGYLFDPNVPERTPLLARVNSLLSGRFEVWHHVFWATPYTHPEEDGIAALVPRGYAVHLQLAGRHVYRRRCTPRH